MWVRLPHVYLNEGVGEIGIHGYCRTKCFRICAYGGMVDTLVLGTSTEIRVSVRV